MRRLETKQDLKDKQSNQQRMIGVTISPSLIEQSTNLLQYCTQSIKQILSPTNNLIYGVQKNQLYNHQMRIVVQLIENYLKQEIPTILITTDNNKYLFNVPSSFQRFTKEHRIKMPIGAYYFFTRSNTATITGLTGLLLTLFDHGDSCKTKLYLDEKLFKYMQELRYKMGFKVAPISYCDWNGRLRRGINDFPHVQEMIKREDFAEIFNNLEHYINNNIKPESRNDASTYYNSETKVFQNEDLRIIPFQVSDGEGEFITNFILQPGPLPGKILNAKLKEYGIVGKAVSQIQKNGKIEIKGKVISFDDVKEPDTPSPDVLILHCNSLQSLSEIYNHPVFRAYLQNEKTYVFGVYHIIEKPEIVSSPQFKQFLSIFPSHVEHTVYNRHYRNSKDSLEDLISMSAQVQLVSALNKHFPLCMPDLLTQQISFIKNFVGETQCIDLMFPERKVRAYKKWQELVVCPKKSWGFKIAAGGEEKKIEFEPIQIPHLNLQLEEQMQQKFAQIDPKVIFLGTGSMKPSKYRNVSSIMVQLTSKDLMMFDCGQGTQIQVADHYGYDRYEETLINLRIIFITHIHSDHNLGILDLISQRNGLIKKRKMNAEENKLFLIIPANVVPWFHSFCQNIENLQDCTEVVFIQSLNNQGFSFEGTMSKDKLLICPKKSEMVEQQDEGISEDEDQLTLIKPEWDEVIKGYEKTQHINLAHFETYLHSIGVVRFLPCPVIHCPQSYGIIVEHKTGIKISYSGDTRPCDEFAEAAMNSTIMIHQATFGDDLASNAESHFHSTVGEAINIGMKSKSWKTALTHFSQRYKSASDIVEPKMYKSNKPKEEYAQKHTIVCFDHFQMNLSKGHIMPYYSRALAAALPKDTKE